jgi:nucleoside 2-deoxyribosyltransferase
MKIYFAGPLFNAAEQEFNSQLTNKLEQLGFKVFLPQRDGVERNKSPYSEMSKEQRRQVMFEIDRDKIIECDIFLFVLDGRVPDEGACVELGIAYSYKFLNKANKLLVGLQTDVRSAFLGSKLNPMIRVPLDCIAENEVDLLDFLKRNII